MSAAPLATPGHVKALLESALKTRPHLDVLVIRARREWRGDERVEAGGASFRVVPISSGLEARERLVEAERAKDRVVLLTDLSPQDLGQDVLARVPKERAWYIEPWELVKSAYGVQRIDPGLREHRWIAEALLERLGRPDGGVVKPPGAVLDQRTAWRVLLRDAMGPGLERPDGRAMLEWTLKEGAVERLLGLPARFREGLAQWVRDDGEGLLPPIVLALADAGHGGDAVPLGLVCQVLFHPERENHPELRDAAVRLETLTGGHPVSTEAGLEWAREAETVLRGLESDGAAERARTLRSRADELLRAVRAERWVALGTATPAALEARLEGFAEQLTTAVGDDVATARERVEFAADAVLRHQLAEERGERVERVEMARRLVRWLAEPRNEPSTEFEELAAAYVREGGFVDRARATLGGGEPHKSLATAYDRLVAAVTERRETENEAFARALAGWLQHGGSGRRVLPVEGLIDRVLVPLLGQTPVLLLVLDGMSQAAFRELIEDIERLRWVRLGIPGFDTPPPLVAALPSVTETCRTSLFFGALTRGAAADEARGFARHPALLQKTGRRRPPVLFPKRELHESGGASLSAELRSVIDDADVKLVAAVINAIDDHLFKGDQVRVRWTVDTIVPLAGLLEAARLAERTVVLVADHGHVLERGAQTMPGGESDRYRPADSEPGAGEIRLVGPRVLADDDSGIVALWSERARYGSKKRGYHGGASPQEVLAPLAVLRPEELVVSSEGTATAWDPLPPDAPHWWTARAAPAERPRVPPPVVPPGPQPPLPGLGPAVSAAWIDALMESELFEEQCRRAGRALRDATMVREFLAAMDAEGMSAIHVALAKRLGMPAFRLGGYLAMMSRALNIEGYAVVENDSEAETVRLDLDLLLRQFGLEKG